GEGILALGTIEGDGSHAVLDVPEEVFRLVAGHGTPVAGEQPGINAFIAHGWISFQVRCACSYMVSPPLTEIDWPVTAPAPAPQSQGPASATSSGVTGRPCGLDLPNSASTASASRPVRATTRATPSRTISVSVYPGQTALTVTPLAASSSASARVRPTTPCLAAQ